MKRPQIWLTDLEGLVSSTLLSGRPVTGWKMVEGRSNRKFADELKVVEAMKSAGYDESLLYERKLITLTQMEKDFGKKAARRAYHQASGQAYSGSCKGQAP